MVLQTKLRTTELREILTDVRDEARLAVDIIDRLRSLAGKKPLELRPVDVNEVTAELLRLVASDARSRGVNLSTELAPSLPPVRADRICLQQVMLNLIVNGMDSMREMEGDGRDLTVCTCRRDDGVEIAVSDTGHGIPNDRMPKLFDAFFTTKKDGVGLGLAIARSIVEAHGGRIWAEDHGGRGATFRLTLPGSA